MNRATAGTAWPWSHAPTPEGLSCPYSAGGHRASRRQWRARLARLASIFILLLTPSLCAATAAKDFTEHIDKLAGRDRTASPGKVTLKDTDRVSTEQSFKPPVEIEIVAKTDSTNLRIAYAADQVIFNWERDNLQLRVSGGPADGQHKHGAGNIPKNKYVTIKWVVLPDRQQIFVDGDLRFEHKGDYSGIDRPVSVFCYQSKVTVTSIRVRQIPEARGR